MAESLANNAPAGRPVRWRAGLILALVATLGSLWIADAAVGFIVPQGKPTLDETRIRAALRAGATIDRRSPLQAVRDLRARGEDAWPTVYIGNYWIPRAVFRDTIYPLAGISGVVSVMCNEGTHITYTADQHGFNNPPERWSAAHTDLALVGDSYVMGWCVPPAESFAALIRRRVPETIVLGFGASGPLTQLAQMREFLPALRPRRVVWFYYENNDQPDLSREKGNPILQRYLDPGFSQQLAARQSQVDDRLKAFAARRESVVTAEESRRPAPDGPVKFTKKVIKLWHLRQLLKRPAPDVWNPECCDLALYRTVVTRAKALVEGWGGTLSVVYLPSEARMSGYPAYGDLAGDSVVALLDTLGVPVLDLRTRLLEFGTVRELVTYPGSHYSTRGHAAVATLVLRQLDSLAPHQAAVPPQ